MKKDWEVTDSSDAVRFLSRVFKHLNQAYDCKSPQNIVSAMAIVVDAQGYVCDALLREAA